MMETLADYGTVAYFGIGVFTTGIFRTWFGMGDAVAATKMAALLLMFVFLLVTLERFSRSRARYHHTSSKYNELPEFRLVGWRAWLASIVCLVPILLGFALPALQLSLWAMETYEEMIDARFLELSFISLHCP